MNLRLDLLEHLSDILKEAEANNHRYKPEPHSSKTGVGSLSSASIADRANEVSIALTRKLRERARRTRRNGA